jgi:hypothetical protein
VYNKQDDLVVAAFTCLYTLLLLVTCSGIFVIIEETIDLEVKYIYIKIDIVLDVRGNVLDTPYIILILKIPLLIK